MIAISTQLYAEKPAWIIAGSKHFTSAPKGQEPDEEASTETAVTEVTDENGASIKIIAHSKAAQSVLSFLRIRNMLADTILVNEDLSNITIPNAPPPPTKYQHNTEVAIDKRSLKQDKSTPSVNYSGLKP